MNKLQKPSPIARQSRTAREVATLLEQAPFEVELWKDLAKCIRAQNDQMSAQSLDAIASSVGELKQKGDQGGKQDRSTSKPSNFATSVFIRLVRSYNNPHLLKQAGMLFFSEWQLPSAALLLFERSMRLGATEKEIEPLKIAALQAIENQEGTKQEGKSDYSGISTVQHVQPVIEDLLVKSGSLLIPLDLQGSLSVVEPAREDEFENGFTLPESTLECITEALQAAKQGKLRKAETLLLKANTDPAWVHKMHDAWFAVGNAAFEASRYPEMKMAYQQAFDFNPSSLASHFNLALAHHLNRDFTRAELYYLCATRLNPNHPKTWCNLGVLYFQIREYEKAEEALRKAVLEDPSYARAWDNLAAVLGSQNKLSGALDACHKAIQLRPEFPEAHFKTGVIYFGKQRLSEAAASFEHAARLPHLAATAFTYLAMIYARMGEITRAESFIREASKVDERSEMLWMAWNDIGKAHYLAGNFSAAISVFEEIAVRRADVAEAWFHLGLCYQVLGDFAKAESFYQHAADLDVGFYSAWHNLGILYAQQGRNRDASDAFRMELRGRPNQTQAWNDLALSLSREGLGEEAAHASARAEYCKKER